MTESRFRERRSAHSDESAPEADAPAAPPSPSVADTPAEAVEPTERTEHVRVDSAKPVDSAQPFEHPQPVEPFQPVEPTQRVDSADRMGDAAEEAGMDLDRLAEMDVPDPSFLELVEPHVEMALRFLGELPLTPEGERRVLPRWAKREIDLLGLLEERTRGNLPPPEQQYLDQALDHLRTLYLKVNR